MTTEAEVFDSLKYRIVDDSGTRKYFNAAGQLHRDDGPAVIRADGTKEWYLNGEWHRDDGPAIEYVKGGSGWFIYDIPYDHEDFDLQVQIPRDYYRTL